MIFKYFILLCIFINGLSAAKVLFSSFEPSYNRVYVGQIFKVKIKILSTINKNVHKIKLGFKSNKSFEILSSKNNSWDINNFEHSYSKYLYFKIKTKNFKFPNINIYLFDKRNKVFATDIVSKFHIEVIKIKKSNGYSSVISKELTLDKYTADKYNEDYNIVALKIEANNSNLEDFNLEFHKQGISSKVLSRDKSKINYFVLVPSNLSVLKFSYFDLTKNRLMYIKVPIKILEQNVSTQIGLNPKDSVFRKYKIISVSIVVVIFLLLFIRYKRVIYLIFLFPAMLFLASEILPLGYIIVQKGTKMKILPTENSTVIYEFIKNEKVEKLAQRREYIKVIINKKIGWIYENNSKN